MSDRPLDLVLFGATGFTGRLVAEYLGKNAPRDLRWALAGRNAQKLEAVKSELGLDVPIRVADAMDRASLDPLVKGTKVVCSTVGPYMQYGRELVASCADAGTHYCDLTGETPFVRDTIDRNHARAEQTGAKIVCCCGFDSIPSDLGTWMIHREAGAPLSEVRMVVWKMSGKLSGGTAASMIGIVRAARRDSKLRRLLGHPYSLDPTPARGPDGSDQKGAKWDPDLKTWTGPFVMAAINTRVVRRSNALLGKAYGPQFKYNESTSFGRGAGGWMRATGFGAGMGAFVAAAAIAPSLVAKGLPSPGDGPNKDERERARFEIRFVAHTDANGSSRRIDARVAGGDPGYGDTAKMLGESAICLAKDELPKRAGVLTPATAMGDALLARVRKAGLTFEIG